MQQEASQCIRSKLDIVTEMFAIMNAGSASKLTSVRHMCIAVWARDSEAERNQQLISIHSETVVAADAQRSFAEC